jgi:saccharopine dehydrogenase-like NADP-dependent oxidoreductase
MRKSVILGSGMVGSVIARDISLNKDFDVLVADRSPESLRKLEILQIKTLTADLSSAENLKEIIRDCDIVVNALPGFLGFAALKSVIEAGKNVVDISFMPEDPFLLDEKAKTHGVTAVVDMGVAPGLSNLICGHARSLLDSGTNCIIMVGGLPKKRILPWEYRMPFSPSDVLEEYTRTARIVEKGRVVLKEALSEPELVDLPDVGTLESFNTDGLRTLIRTLDIPDMKEKTLRYPGYVKNLKLLIDSGFFSRESVEAGNVRIRPIDLTAQLLFNKWRLEEGEEEFTVMRVEVGGEKDGRSIIFVYDLFDEYDRKTGTSSMARTTGFPASVMAQLMAEKKILPPGIVPPEIIGMESSIYDQIIHELQTRRVIVREKVCTGSR